MRRIVVSTCPIRSLLSDVGEHSYPGSPNRPAQHTPPCSAYSTTDGKELILTPTQSQTLQRGYRSSGAQSTPAGRDTLGRIQPSHTTPPADPTLNGPRPAQVKDYRCVCMRNQINHIYLFICIKQSYINTFMASIRVKMFPPTAVNNPSIPSISSLLLLLLHLPRSSPQLRQPSTARPLPPPPLPPPFLPAPWPPCPAPTAHLLRLLLHHLPLDPQHTRTRLHTSCLQLLLR